MTSIKLISNFPKIIPAHFQLTSICLYGARMSTNASIDSFYSKKHFIRLVTGRYLGNSLMEVCHQIYLPYWRQGKLPILRWNDF